VHALGGDPARLVNGHQVHGATVAVVGRGDGCREAIPATDGLVTVDRGTTLMVQGADCPLVLLVDPSAAVLGVAHSGWRGTVAGIGGRTVAMMAQLGARPDRIEAAVFPGIAACCFEIGPEVVTAFEQAFGPRALQWRKRPAGDTDRAFLDLPAAIHAALVDAGLAAAAIDLVPGCTACDGRLWSHRASGGAPERHGLFAVLV